LAWPFPVSIQAERKRQRPSALTQPMSEPTQKVWYGIRLNGLPAAGPSVIVNTDGKKSIARCASSGRQK
jgi:hypothetical protein